VQYKYADKSNIYKKYISQSGLLSAYLRTFVQNELIVSHMSPQIKFSEVFKIVSAFYSSISRGRIKRRSLFSNVSTVYITLWRGQKGLNGNALRHIHTHLLNMSFIHHASLK
jgi:hypothetical protein